MKENWLLSLFFCHWLVAHLLIHKETITFKNLIIASSFQFWLNKIKHVSFALNDWFHIIIQWNFLHQVFFFRLWYVTSCRNSHDFKRDIRITSLQQINHLMCLYQGQLKKLWQIYDFNWHMSPVVRDCIIFFILETCPM